MNYFNAFLNGRYARLTNPRRVKIVGVALLFLSLSLAGIYAIALIPDALSTLAGIVGDYPVYIRLTNAILAVVCAVFFLWPREGGRLVGRWNDCLGLVFFTFFLQYGCRAFAVYAETLLTPEHQMLAETIGWITITVVYVCSLLNNLLTLAAARILLNKNRKVAQESRAPSEEVGLPAKLKYRLVMLQAALPAWNSSTWVLLVLIVCVLPMLEEARYPYAVYYPYFIWVRIPDAIFSVFCLCWFAYAVWLGFSVRRFRVLAAVGFVVVLSYGGAMLVYAGNPFIAYAVLNAQARERHPLVRWFWERLEPEMSKAARTKGEGAEDREAAGGAQGTTAGRFSDSRVAAEFRPAGGAKPLTPENFLDGAIFAILFPMKYLLFLPAFFLYFLSIVSINDFRKALRKTKSKRHDYLSADGVLSVIGTSMGADEVELDIRLPGVKGRRGDGKERVLAEIWRAPGVRVNGRKARVFALDEDSLLYAVMKRDGRVKVETNEGGFWIASESRWIIPPPKTLVVIPVRFHGGVIGALRVTFRGFGKYNDGTLEQLKFIAEHLAPSVQDFRTVALIDKLPPRLSRVQAGGPADGFEEAALRMVEALQDLLNALGVGLIIECGFKSFKPVYPESGPYYEILKRQEAYYEKKKRQVVLTADGPVRVEHEQLPIRTERGEPYKLGNLTLAIPDDSDEFDRPTVGASYLTRRMLSSLIAQSITGAARTALLTVIEGLNDALNIETLTVEEWFAGVEAMVRKAGLLWVVASEGEGRPLRGRPEHVALVSGFDPLESESLFGNPLGCVPVRGTDSDAHHVIHLGLGKPGRSLLLGVEREQFGRELNFRSPWKVFLESLANSAGAALSRIEDRRDAEARRHREEEERLRAAEDEMVETVGIISAMLMHELVNMVQDQSYTVAELLELAGGDAPLPENQLITSLTSVKDSAAMMLELARAWKEMIRGDASCSCKLRQAAQQALRLFQFGILEKQIKVESEIPAGAFAHVPANFVALAFASLLGNAIDATRPKGKIKIVVKTDEKEEYILCDVIDDGQPIPKHIVPLLFQRGTTNKVEHSGWGLYLVSRLLKKYGGEAFLSYSNDKATCLTLRLPTSAD